mmetsp:Transcript_6857/g.18523  ORF Transcript_6857/g.18523 Transcript_6857/m.18523 type:complete len:510 (-) Transcript_6857:243-1772(-)
MEPIVAQGFGSGSSLGGTIGSMSGTSRSRPPCVLSMLGALPWMALAGEYYWPQQKGDVNRTGYSPYAVTTNLETKPTWVWEDPYTDVIRCTPLIDDKKNIYLGTQSGRMYKFSPDGAMLWSYRSRRGNTPTVSSLMEGSVYLNTAYGFVVALDMETGKERWATQISRETAGDTACVFALNKTIISATQMNPETRPDNAHRNTAIVALNDDGTYRWTFTTKIPTFNFQGSSPGDGTLVFQDHAGGLFRVRLDDGSLVWESGIKDRMMFFFTTGAAVCGPNGLVYVSSNYYDRGIIHAYRLEDGQQVWRREVGMPVNQAVAYGVLAGNPKPAVVAGIGENPGMPLSMSLPGWMPNYLRAAIHWASIWTAGRPNWFWGTHVLPAAIVALDAETGETRWSYTPPPFTRPSCEGDEASLEKRQEMAKKFPEFGIDAICLPDDWAQAVIGGDGTTYIGHQDGKLYAVRDANGNGQIEDSEVSTHYFGHAFQGSQAIAPGMLAVAPCGGGLYVWKN